jgi:hypothetical protein
MKFILFVTFLCSKNILFSQSKKEQLEILQFKIDSLTLNYNTDLNQKVARIYVLNQKLDSLEKELEEKNKKYITKAHELEKVLAQNEDLTIQLARELNCDYENLFKERNLGKVVKQISDCQYKVFTNSVYAHFEKVTIFNILREEKYLGLNDELLWYLVNRIVHDVSAGNEMMYFFNSAEWNQFASKYTNDNITMLTLHRDFSNAIGYEYIYDNEAVRLGKYYVLSLNAAAMGSEFQKNCFKIENDTLIEVNFDFVDFYNKIQSTFHSDDIRFWEIKNENGTNWFYFSIHNLNGNGNNGPGPIGEIRVILDSNDKISIAEYSTKLKNGTNTSWKKF